MRGHRSLQCAYLNNPNDIGNPLLWSTQGGTLEFMHNSSMAESTNAWLSRECKRRRDNVLAL